MMSNAEQRLRSAIYTDTKKICRETEAYLNVEFERNALDIIAELTWRKLQEFGLDLDAFQKHAKRATITADDVRLLVRKNESLKKFVEEKSKKFTQNKEVVNANRKRKASAITD